MFDIGWSEFLLIAVVALIAIGPKELPGVLRMVGQWMGKARKMAAEFQGQFQEAMREAEMADLKKSFDEVKEAASGFTGGNLMTSLREGRRQRARYRRHRQAGGSRRRNPRGRSARDVEWRCGDQCNAGGADPRNLHRGRRTGAGIAAAGDHAGSPRPRRAAGHRARNA